jgi:energy-coupling factor transporter ATP-binding protein EcfA2
MDEPEVSLHIEWQKKLIGFLRELNPNVQLIIATHSPAMIMNGWMDKVFNVEDITVKQPKWPPMSSFTDYLESDYFEAYANLLPDSQPNPIVVYVESDEDIAFWRSIFRPYENEEFVFEFKLPSKSSLAKGKLQALKRSQEIFDTVTGELGSYMLICVDSD